MKKWMLWGLIAVLALGLIGCRGQIDKGQQDNQKVVQNALVVKKDITYGDVTISFDAVDGKAVQMTQVVSTNLTGLNKESIDSLQEGVEKMKKEMSDNKAVKFSYAYENNRLNTKTVIDYRHKDWIPEKGLNVDNDHPNEYSIEKYQEFYKNNGWEVVKNK